MNPEYTEYNNFTGYDKLKPEHDYESDHYELIDVYDMGIPGLGIHVIDTKEQEVERKEAERDPYKSTSTVRTSVRYINDLRHYFTVHDDSNEEFITGLTKIENFLFKEISYKEKYWREICKTNSELFIGTI